MDLNARHNNPHRYHGLEVQVQRLLKLIIWLSYFNMNTSGRKAVASHDGIRALPALHTVKGGNEGLEPGPCKRKQMNMYKHH